MPAHAQHAELPPELSIVNLHTLNSPDYLDGYLRTSNSAKVDIARPTPSYLVLDTEGVGHARKRGVAVLRGTVSGQGAHASVGCKGYNSWVSQSGKNGASFLRKGRTERKKVETSSNTPNNEK